MPSIPVIRTVLRELITRERSERIPEPDLVMDDPKKVAAYTQAGREDGVMASVYLFHCSQICEIIRPGETVLDLGCGPATQLAMVARLNPETKFIGVDLSDDMLKKAKAYASEQQLNNIEFRQGDITDLSIFKDHSVDVIISTVALHHLPDINALERTFSEISRVLKNDGGLYLVDFGHLKSEKSIRYFAYQYADRQPELYTLDYLYSLRAAFSLTDFRNLASKHLNQATLYSTFLIPFMILIKNQPHTGGSVSMKVIEDLHALRDQLTPPYKRDLNDLRTFFRHGGLQNKLLD